VCLIPGAFVVKGILELEEEEKKSKKRIEAGTSFNRRFSGFHDVYCPNGCLQPVLTSIFV
jgi:hypothetical protein